MAWEPSLGAFYGPLAFVVAVDIVYFLVVLAMLRRYPGRRHELKDKQEALPTSTSTSSASSFVPIATVVATEEERRRLAETTTAMTGVVNDDGNLDDDTQLANEHGFAVQLRGVAASLGLFILLWGCGGVAVAAGRGGALGLTGACLYGGVALALSAFLLSQHMIGRRDVRALLARSCPRPNSSERQYPPSTSTANSCFCCRRRHVGLTDVAPFSVAMRASSNNPGPAHQLAPTLAPSSGESCATNRSHASSNLRPSAKLTNLQAEAQSRPLGHGPFHPLPLAPLDNSLTEPSVDNDITLHLNPPLQVCYTRSAGPSNVATATATTPTTINPPSAPPAPTTVTPILETNNNNGQIAVIPSSSSANGTAEGVVPGPFGRINRNRVRSWRAGRLAVLREYAYDVPTSAEGSNASHGSTRRSQVNPGAIRHHASRSHHANRSSSSRRASWNAIRNSNAGENNNRSSNKLTSRNANSSEDTNRNASPNFLKSTSETLNGNGNIRHNGAPFRLPPRPNRYRHAHRHQKHTHHHHHGNQASRNRGRGSSSSDEECSRPNTHTKQRHNDVINLAHSHFHVKAQQSHESHNGSTTQTLPKTHVQSNTHTQSHHHGSDLVHLQKEKHCDVNDYTHAQSDTHICTQPIHDPNISEIAMYHTDTQSHTPLHDGNGTLELAYNDITDSILEIASKNSESMGAIDDNKDNDDESVGLAMSLCDEEDETNRSICEKEVEEDHQGSFPFIPQFSSIHSSQASPHQQPPQMSPSRPTLPLPSSPTSSSPLSPSSPFFSPPSPLPSLDSPCSPDQLLLLSSSPSHYPPLPPLPLLLPLQDKEQNYGLNLAPPVNHASKTSNRTPNCSTSGQHQTSSTTADFSGANIGPGNFSQAPLNSEIGSPALDTGSVVGSLGPNQGSGGVLTASKGIHGTGFSCGPNIVSRPYQEFGTSSSGPEVVHGNRSCAADPTSRTSPVSPDSKTDYLGSKSGTGIGSPRPSVIPGTVSKFENHTAPLSLDPRLNTHNAPLPLKPPLSTEQSSTIGHPTVRTGLWKHETTV